MLALLRGITSNHNGDFYCLNCFHSYSTKNKHKAHEKLYNDHDYCYVEMPSENNEILKYNNGEKSMKAPFITYADLEYLLEKMHSCQSNPEKFYTEKNYAYTFWLFNFYKLFIWFNGVALNKNKPDCYRSKDCMEKFCKDLKSMQQK